MPCRSLRWFVSSPARQSGFFVVLGGKVPVLLVIGLLAWAPAWGVIGQTAFAAKDSATVASTALTNATTYLISQQADDGGFLGFSGTTDAGVTTDAIFALVAAETSGVPVEPALTHASTYLVTQGATYAASGPGQAAKVALAAIALGQDPTTFAGIDLIAAALGGPGATSVTPVLPNTYGDDLYDHALILLALAAANEPVPPAAIEVLRSAQLADGAWSFAGTTDPASGDSNTTALLIQALVATGHGDDAMIDAGLHYLQSVQSESGQFAYQLADPLIPDANSSALAVQAIIATDGDPASAIWRDAAAGLAAFQNPSGAFRYQDNDPTDNLFATLQAIPALSAVPFPIVSACTGNAGSIPTPVSLTSPACVELEHVA